MEVAYTDELFYPIECTILLLRKFQEVDPHPVTNALSMPATCLHELRSQYGAPADAFSAVMDELTELINYVWERISIPKEKLAIYFKQINGSGLCPAAMFTSLMRMGVRLSAISESERLFYMQGLLQGFSSGGLILYEQTDLHNEQELFDYVDSMDGTQEIKWEALRLYHHWEEYERDIYEALAEAEVLFREKEEPLLKLARATTARVRKEVEAKGQECLRDFYHVRPESDHLLIAPSLLLFQNVSIHILEAPHAETVNNSYMWIGILLHQIKELSAHCGISIESLSTKLKLLGDKRRLQILQGLRRQPMCGQELAELTGLTPATISHHMSALMGEGLVNLDKLGIKSSYTISEDALGRLLDNLHSLLLE